MFGVIFEMSPEASKVSQFLFATGEGEEKPISLLRLQPGEVNTILSYFIWPFTLGPFQVCDGKKHIYSCVDCISDRPPNHSEAPVSPRQNSMNPALVPAAPLVGTRTCLPPVSNREIQLPCHLWQEGKDCTLKELKMSGSYWADDSCLPTLISECIMS